MFEEAKMILDDAKESMEASLAHLEKELLKIRTGKGGLNPLVIFTDLISYHIEAWTSVGTAIIFLYNLGHWVGYI